MTTSNTHLYGGYFYVQLNPSPNLFIYKKNPGFTTIGSAVTGSVTANVPNTLELMAHGSTTLSITRNGSAAVTATTDSSSPLTTGVGALLVEDALAYFHYAFARKWASADPTTTVGASIR
jgi:hypothetical protein